MGRFVLDAHPFFLCDKTRDGHGHEVPCLQRGRLRKQRGQHCSKHPQEPGGLRREPEIETEALQDLEEVGAKEVREPAIADLAPLLCGAHLLKKHHEHIARLGNDVEGIARRTALRRARAAAEFTLTSQEDMLEGLLSVVKTRSNAGSWKAVLFVEHVRFDETTVDTRVYFPNDDDRALRQQAKLVIVEKDWAVLLEQQPGLQDDVTNSSVLSERSYFVLEGHFSPQARAAANATGETLSEVLKTVFETVGAVPSKRLFEDCVRIAETDANGANARAELLLLQHRAVLGHGEWQHLHTYCVGHKAHASATKTWSLDTSCLAGMIHTGKELSESGAMKELRGSMDRLLETRFKWVPGAVPPLQADAVTYKDAILQFFAPRVEDARKRSILEAAKAFFNSDWRSSEVKHACPGSHCCLDQDSSLRKAQVLMKKVLSACPPRILNRSNWLEWSKTTFFGVAVGIHHFIADACALLWAGTAQQRSTGSACNANELEGFGLHILDVQSAPPTGVGNMGVEGDVAQPEPDVGADPLAAERLQRATSLRIAKEFMSSELLYTMLLMRVPLEPQRVFMASVLELTGSKWERSRCTMCWRQALASCVGSCCRRALL